MHEAVVATLLERSRERLREARSAILQVPDQLGAVKRSAVDAALAMTEAALRADVEELRGNVAAAHALIRRCRFPREEHAGLFGALAELAFALEDLDQGAAAADYPETETRIALPPQHLVPRGAIAGELDALEARLAEFDTRLVEIEAQKAGTPEHADQDALVDYVADHAGAQSTIAHQLARQGQVDVRGLSHAVEGLGRVVASFVATVAPAVARVTSGLRGAARSLGQAARRVVGAGGTVERAIPPPVSVSVAAQATPDETLEQREARYRAEGRIKIDAKLVHGAPDGWFLPGAGKTEWFKDHELGPEMVVIPAGSFMMGSPFADDESPPHNVSIRRPFAVGRHAVTFDEWKVALVAGGVAAIPDDEGWGRGRRPVINVSWSQAMRYCEWLSAASGRLYRLPSEAEWEYFCRARGREDFWWGDTIDSAQANYNANYSFKGEAKGEYRQRTVPVDSFEPNPWGLYQVHGNVWEWCSDTWHENYLGAPADGSSWESADSSLRSMRGGSWDYGPIDLRSSYRDWKRPESPNYNIGFRIVCDLFVKVEGEPY